MYRIIYKKKSYEMLFFQNERVDKLFSEIGSYDQLVIQSLLQIIFEDITGVGTFSCSCQFVVTEKRIH